MPTLSPTTKAYARWQKAKLPVIIVLSSLGGILVGGTAFCLYTRKEAIKADTINTLHAVELG